MRITPLRVLVVVLLAALATGSAWADAPVITVNSPTNGTTLYRASFPTVVTLDFNLSHSPLGDVHVFDVLVDGSSILLDGEPIGDPFDNNNNTCREAMNQNGLTCSTSSSDDAHITVPWTVNTPSGTPHSIVFTVKHQRFGEEEEISVTVTVAVELPAPPAIANAYINSTGYKYTAKKRGCIISQIALNHAQDSKYGDKGGPYNDRLVQADVFAYADSCPQ